MSANRRAARPTCPDTVRQVRPRLTVPALTVALVVALAGCGSDGDGSGTSSPTDTPSPTATTLPADWSGMALRGQLTGWGALDVTELSPPANLMGPNFSYTLGAVGVTRELPPGFSHQFDLPPATAAEGHEIVLVEFGRLPEGARPLVDNPGKPARIEVLGGPKLGPAMFGQNYPEGVYAFSVPTGGHPVLRVTDEGRVQSLDLRTGRRGADAVPGFHPMRKGSHQFSSPGRTGWLYFRISGKGASGIPSSRRLAATHLTRLDVALSPWTEERGWAPAGKAWLLVEPHVSSGQVKTVDPEVSFEMGPESFRATGPDGTTYPLRGEPVTSTPLSDAPILTAATAVPASLASVTIRFAPRPTGSTSKGKVTLTPYQGGSQSATVKIR
jgi:hypothetical protein